MIGESKDHVKNYTANVARVLAAVDGWFAEKGEVGKHWSALLTAPFEVYADYFKRLVFFKLLSRNVTVVTIAVFVSVDASNWARRNRRP